MKSCVCIWSVSCWFQIADQDFTTPSCLYQWLVTFVSNEKLGSSHAVRELFKTCCTSSCTLHGLPKSYSHVQLKKLTKPQQFLSSQRIQFQKSKSFWNSWIKRKLDVLSGMEVGRGHHQLARMTLRTSQLHLILYQPFSTSLFLFFFLLNVTNFQNHPEFFSNKAYQSISEYEDTISPLGNDTFIFIFSMGLTPQFSPQKANVIWFWVIHT